VNRGLEIEDFYSLQMKLRWWAAGIFRWAMQIE
jgi:hypothetical protein